MFGEACSGSGSEQLQTGTALVKYSPILTTEVIVQSNGRSTSAKVKLHCITIMREYKNKSIEELRLEDHMAFRSKWSIIGEPWLSLSGGFDKLPATKPPFGGFDKPAQTKPRFGGFGKPAETKSPFGGFNKPAETKSPFWEFDKPAETKSPFESINKPAETKSPFWEFDKPAETKSPFWEFDKPAETKSPFERFNKPAETKSPFERFNKPAETKSPFERFNKPAETKSPFERFNKPAEAKSPFWGFDKPAEAKSPNGKSGSKQLETGTALVTYNPVLDTEVIVQSNGRSTSTNVKFHCITIMKEYENKSIEELRLEDRMVGRGKFSFLGDPWNFLSWRLDSEQLLAKLLFRGFDKPAEAKSPNGQSEDGPSESLFGNASGEGTSTMASGGTGSNIPSWEIPECPVCLETLTVPIVQCQGGHSMCGACSKALTLRKCPVCRKPMTSTRNWTLEDIVEKAAAARARAVNRACANAAAGCARVFRTGCERDAEDHAQECIFRDMLCPLNHAYGDCFWIGKPKEIMDHFKQKHPSNCLVPGSVVRVRGVREGHSARNVWLLALAQDDMHFIVSMKTDPDGVDWVVHHIGSKKNANLYIYEIHVISYQDEARRAVFSERCPGAAEMAAAAFGAGGCAALPARLLPHFARDGELGFRCHVRKEPPAARPPDISNLTLG